MGNAMNKVQRCLLHFRCIARKSLLCRESAWHWQHLLRELGLGIYARPAPVLNTRQCYT